MKNCKNKPFKTKGVTQSTNNQLITNVYLTQNKQIKKLPLEFASLGSP